MLNIQRKMEHELDDIAEGQDEYAHALQKVLQIYFQPFALINAYDKNGSDCTERKNWEKKMS